MAAGGSDFSAVGGELSPTTGGDCGTIGDSGEAFGLSGGHVVALCTFHSTGFNIDGGLVESSASGVDKQGLQHGLRTVVVDGVSLLVENKAVEDETTLSFVIV